MKGVLVIVPCGQRKIWDKHPDEGVTPARNAHIGGPFKVNSEYAEIRMNTKTPGAQPWGEVL